MDVRMHNDYAPSMADWISLLSISTRLIFEKVRERAIKEITARLDQVDPFELIGLAVKYDVEQWLKHAYRRIVTRNDLITYQEALKISLSMAIMLMRAREQYWKDPVHNHQHHYGQPASVFGQPAGAFGQPAGAFGQPAGIFGQPAGIFGQPVNDTVWPRGPPDSIIDSEISVMESASVETGPPKTGPNTGQ